MTNKGGDARAKAKGVGTQGASSKACNAGDAKPGQQQRMMTDFLGGVKKANAEPGALPCWVGTQSSL